MLKDKSLKAFIGMIAFAAVLLVAPQRAKAQSLSAQLTDKDIMVSEFNAVNVSDDFDVTVSRGTYGVRLTVDKELAPYVEVYVRSKVQIPGEEPEAHRFLRPYQHEEERRCEHESQDGPWR